MPVLVLQCCMAVPTLMDNKDLEDAWMFWISLDVTHDRSSSSLKWIRTDPAATITAYHSCYSRSLSNSLWSVSLLHCGHHPLPSWGLFRLQGWKWEVGMMARADGLSPWLGQEALSVPAM